MKIDRDGLDEDELSKIMYEIHQTLIKRHVAFFVNLPKDVFWELSKYKLTEDDHQRCFVNIHSDILLHALSVFVISIAKEGLELEVVNDISERLRQIVEENIHMVDGCEKS